jgi:hypothetical protein
MKIENAWKYLSERARDMRIILLSTPFHTFRKLSDYKLPLKLPNSDEKLFAPLTPNIPYQTQHLDSSNKISHSPFLSVLFVLIINM